MDWDILVALPGGAVTSIATTWDAAAIRDRRAEKRRRVADRRALTEQLQERVSALVGDWGISTARRRIAEKHGATNDDDDTTLVDPFYLNVSHANLLGSRLHDLRAANALTSLGPVWKALREASGVDERIAAEEKMAAAISNVAGKPGVTLQEPQTREGRAAGFPRCREERLQAVATARCAHVRAGACAAPVQSSVRVNGHHSSWDKIGRVDA